MKKHWLVAIALICFGSVAQAQTTSPATNSEIQQFEAWLGQQKAYAGLGCLTKGDKAKWATTSWDLVQFGKAGINVAQPSNTLDYVDIAPVTAVANGRAPRYGACVPVHGGNIWNGLPKNSHVNTTSLPPFIVGYCFLYPYDSGINLPIDRIRPWSRDGMITFTYGFGGS